MASPLLVSLNFIFTDDVAGSKVSIAGAIGPVVSFGAAEVSFEYEMFYIS